MGLFRAVAGKVRRTLAKTREALVAPLRSLLTGRRVDESLFGEMESLLVRADLGVAASRRLVETARSAARSKGLTDAEQLIPELRRELESMLSGEDRSLRFAESGPTAMLVAGVNGVGKTTSVAKIAQELRRRGKSVLLAACDTYRAGAVRQLEIWSERLGVELIKGAEGADPASVAFDAAAAAVARGVDVLLVDTAGRMHTDDALLRQLTKIRGVIGKHIHGGPHETFLVLDATTGQNAVQQARRFDEAVELSAIFLAKLDGTARGGVVVAIQEAVGVPVKLVGTGETPEDVEPFDPDSFVRALFAVEEVEGASA